MWGEKKKKNIETLECGHRKWRKKHGLQPLSVNSKGKFTQEAKPDFKHLTYPIQKTYNGQSVSWMTKPMWADLSLEVLPNFHQERKIIWVMFLRNLFKDHLKKVGWSLWFHFFFLRIFFFQFVRVFKMIIMVIVSFKPFVIRYRVGVTKIFICKMVRELL